MNSKSSIFFKIFIFVVLSIIVGYTIFSIPTIFWEDGEIILTKSQFQSLNNVETISASLNDEKEQQIKDFVISYKLFDLFNIKNAKVSVVDNQNVYAGGNVLGFDITTKGLTIIGSNYVVTQNGIVEPIKSSGLKVGDIITKIGIIDINDVDDINTALVLSHGKEMNVEYIRANENNSTTITPALDIQTNSYKLGLWVKNDATGLGTLTFVNDEKSKYASLGHAITNGVDNSPINVAGGDLYNCTILGVKRGKSGAAGEIQGVFSLGSDVQGDIVYNGNTGLYGNLDESSNLTADKSLISVGTRLDVHPGSAKILCTLDDSGIKAYDIEIIKTSFQSKSSEKSMIIKVTDEELLQKTGGIIQGMSGSPIIQNGKLVGAVTHVFVNDPTKGFGIYIDWMLETMENVL